MIVLEHESKAVISKLSDNKKLIVSIRRFER